MREMTSALIAFAEFLSTPVGFISVITSMVCGMLLAWAFGFSDTALTVLNLYLSILAIVIGSTILVSSDRDTRAIHTKLDEIILASDATNRAVGLERRPVEEIEAVRKAAEEQCDDDDAG